MLKVMHLASDEARIMQVSDVYIYLSKTNTTGIKH